MTSPPIQRHSSVLILAFSFLSYASIFEDSVALYPSFSSLTLTTVLSQGRKYIYILKDRTDERKAWLARDRLPASSQPQSSVGGIIYPEALMCLKISHLSYRSRRKMRCKFRAKKSPLLPSHQTRNYSLPSGPDLLVKVSPLCRPDLKW
jgi:hypothetical protein